MSEKVQYLIVGIIFLAAIIWAGVKAYSFGKGKGNDACCGCALSDACKKKDKGEAESCEDKEIEK